MKKLILFACSVFISFLSIAQYNECAGKNTVYKTESIEERLDDGTVVTKRVKRKVAADKFGNANGNQYDLAIDGAFDGQTIVVLHLYTGEGFDFALPKSALAEKGFSVYRYLNNPPSAKELKSKLDSACQLWVISSSESKLNSDHIGVIKNFFNSGKGVYIWGDNQPYYADANKLSKALFGVKMTGNVMGDKVVNLQNDSTQIGIKRDHLLSTGLENIYEGITIATIDSNEIFTPLIYGSSGNLVTAVYEKNGKRAVLDGGFTRLFIKWDTAGTARYVKNAASWLVNYEKFGDRVLNEKSSKSNKKKKNKMQG